MYIKTKNAVTFNLMIKGTATEVVTGHIEGTQEKDNFDTIAVRFVYKRPDGSLIQSGIAHFPKIDMNQIFDEIKAGLPDVMTTDWTLWRKTQMNTAFMTVMAESFGIDVADIELVSEEND